MRFFLKVLLCLFFLPASVAFADLCSQVFPTAPVANSAFSLNPPGRSNTLLNLNNNSTLNITASNNTFFGTGSVGNNVDFIVNGSGTARVHFNGPVTIGSNVEINRNGDPKDLIIYINGDLVVGDNAQVNAIIFVNGAANIGNNGRINGALTSSRTISSGNNASVNFDINAINNADFAKLCDSTVPLVCQTYRDEFSLASFTNNDGTLNWVGGWQEFDNTGAGTNAGGVSIVGNRLRITGMDNVMNNNSMTRQASGSGFTSAQLTFDYDPSSRLERDDRMLVEISTDGGNNFTLLDTLQGLQGDPGVLRYSRNITGNLADDMRIRLRVAPDNGTGGCCFGPNNEFIDFDNVELQMCRPDNFQWEGGTLDLSIGSVQTINFARTYQSPVVFAMAMSRNEAPTHVRVVSTSAKSAQIVAVEPPNEDGAGLETVSYIVAEEGVFNLPGGKRVEVRKVDVSAVQQGFFGAAESFQRIGFLQRFPSSPALLTNISTNNNGNSNNGGSFNTPWLSTVARSVNNSGFDAALGRAQVRAGTVNRAETYTYLAVDTGVLPNFISSALGVNVTAEAVTTNFVVRDSCRTINLAQTFVAGAPSFVSVINGHAGIDGGWVRGCSSTARSVAIRVDEDRFIDSERRHTGEATTTIVFDTAVRPPIDHYGVSHDGSGITCLLEDITITAENNTGVAVDANRSTINISTTSGRGDWVGIVSGATNLNRGTAGDGAASFTFAAGASSAVLRFAHPVITGNSQTFGFNVSDGTISETSNAAVAADDPNITYTLAGFRFINAAGGPLPNQIAAKSSTADPNADTLYLQAVRASDNDPSVCVAAFSSPATRTVQLAAQCDNPATCTGSPAQTFNVAGANIALNNANPVIPTNFTNVNLKFDNQARAPIPLNYSDAGQMQLHARFTAQDTGAVLTGASNQFVVRPFAFGFNVINAGVAFNPRGDELSDASSGFTSAGSNFNVAVNAYRYDENDDANRDGIPDNGKNVTDNGVTPNFTGDVTLSVAGFTPTKGRQGNLTGGTTVRLPIGASGVTSTLQYDEVGSINLKADHSNYLNQSGLNITSAPVKIGRFFPDHFALSSSAVTGACTTFTYMQQPFGSVNVGVEARNVAGNITQNYDSSRYSSDIAKFGLGAEIDSRDETARLQVGTFPGWRDGTASGAITDVIFQRQGGANGLEDGPFSNLRLGLRINSELDNVNFKPADFNLLSSRAVAIGGTQNLRYGRVQLASAHGPETQNLPVPFTVEYWNGNSFVVNSNDSAACSAIPLTNIAFNGSAINVSTNRNVTLGSRTTAGTLNINGANAQANLGDYNLIFSAPGAGAVGSFPVQINNLNDWLRYDWSGNGQANDLPPPAIITFGRMRGDDRTIFWQERLQ